MNQFLSHGLLALNAMEMRSPNPSKRSTRCSSQDGKMSRCPVAAENGIPIPEPTQGKSIPGVSYIETEGPRGSRK